MNAPDNTNLPPQPFCRGPKTFVTVAVSSPLLGCYHKSIAIDYGLAPNLERWRIANALDDLTCDCQAYFRNPRIGAVDATVAEIEATFRNASAKSRKG